MAFRNRSDEADAISCTIQHEGGSWQLSGVRYFTGELGLPGVSGQP